jgi:hypothetical protein
MVEILATIIVVFIAVAVGFNVVFFIALGLLTFVVAVVQAIAFVVATFLRIMLLPFTLIGRRITLPAMPGIELSEAAKRHVSLAITGVGIAIFFVLPALLMTLQHLGAI